MPRPHRQAPPTLRSPDPGSAKTRLPPLPSQRLRSRRGAAARSPGLSRERSTHPPGGRQTPRRGHPWPPQVSGREPAGRAQLTRPGSQTSDSREYPPRCEPPQNTRRRPECPSTTRALRPYRDRKRHSPQLAGRAGSETGGPRFPRLHGRPSARRSTPSSHRRNPSSRGPGGRRPSPRSCGVLRPRVPPPPGRPVRSSRHPWRWRPARCRSCARVREHPRRSCP